MRRSTKVWLLLIAATIGCLATRQLSLGGGFFGNTGCQGHCGVRYPGPGMAGFQGPWGQPVEPVAPYSSNISEAEARSVMSNSLPLSMVEFSSIPTAPGVARTGFIQPAGMSTMPGPANTGDIQLAGGEKCPGCPPPPGATAIVGAITGGGPNRFPTKRTSVRFLSPAGMKISWYAPTCDGRCGFSSTQIEAPGRYNFVQAAIYRLKISDIANRPGLELYPTLEVVPSNCKTDPFLAHSSVPISFTDEDFDQVASGNFVVKVIYLPDPQFQDLATTGPDEVVSSRLEPGVDPVAEAHRRGSILLIIRIGNIDLEAPNTPAMDAPSPYQPKPMMPHAMAAPGAAGMMPPNMMMGQANPMMGNPMMGNPMMANPMAGRSNAMMPPNAAMMGQQGKAMAPNGAVMMMGPNGPVIVAPNGQVIGAAPAAIGNPATQPGAMLPPTMPTAPVAPQPPAGMPQTPTAPINTGTPSTKADVPVSGVQQAKYQPAAVAGGEIQQAKFKPTTVPANITVKQASYEVIPLSEVGKKPPQVTPLYDGSKNANAASAAPAQGKTDVAKKPQKSGIWSLFK